MFVRRRIALLAILAALGACSKKNEDSGNNTVAETSAEAPKPAQETVKSAEGRNYDVERVGNIKPEDLPMNTDLKMADKDMAKYAKTLCMLDVGQLGTPVNRCDVFVQPDKDGTLLGYVAVVTDKDGSRLESAVTTNEKKASSDSTGCILNGKLYGDDNKQITDPTKDFETSIAYSAWEKEPGNWLVSQEDPNGQADDNPDAQMGMWYVKRSGDKLQINQERWNYCYGPKSDVSVDDVYYRVLTLTANKQPKV